MSTRKIVATIGPATASVEAIAALRAAGMDVARLNGSHADLAWHREAIRLIRAAAPDVPILMDIPGRKIRTTQLAHEPSFRAGDALVLTTDTAHDGREKVPVNYDALHLDLAPGDTILADDGRLQFTVRAIDGRDIICRCETAGTLRSAKGINVPLVTLRTAQVTDHDRAVLAFARDEDVDMVGISFVESREHVDAIREVIGSVRPAIVAKIENRNGLARVADIVRAADAIMIDRGDLSVETSIESVALSQKAILTAARLASCPVIVATEMLHSMITSATPTKAEVSDITNAVLDGASAVMLSGETAIGAFPIESVATMRRIIDHTSKFSAAKQAFAGASIPDAVSAAVGAICALAPITKIVAVTLSGFAARVIASQMPRQPIFAISNDARNARAFNLLPGVTGLAMDVPFSRRSTEHIPQCLEFIWRRGLIVEEDLVLVVSVSYPRPGNRMNSIEVHRAGDLAETFGWAPQAPVH